MPSPSKLKGGMPLLEPDRGRLDTGEPLLFWKPISVSSMPSKGPTEPSTMVTTLPSAFCTTNTAQLGEDPMAGHWLKGGVGRGRLAAAAGVAMPTESTAIESVANKMTSRFSFNFAPRKTGKEGRAS